MRSVNILGVRVDDVTMEETLSTIEGWVSAPRERCRMVSSVNPEFVMAARRRPEFARALAESDLNLPDGANLVRAARFLGHPLRERVAGSDLAPRLADQAGKAGYRLFLLGSRDGVAEEAAARLRARYPGLVICGTWEGSPAREEEEGIISRVNASNADLVLVAYGAPAQDLWIWRNRERLGAGVAIGVGGTLDFIAGRVPRAPEWMQRAGMEWLFRLARQPWRIKRQSVLLEFTWLVVRERMKKGSG